MPESRNSIMRSREDSPVLVAENGPLAGQRWHLAQDELVIGRSSDCDLVVPERQVSRKHARVKQAHGGYVLEDLDSKNGTHVNGALITEPVRLQDGDVIQIALAVRLAFLGSEATVPLSDEAIPAAGGDTLRLDPQARRVWVGEREIDPPLSLPQYRLVELLHNNSGKVCSRDQVVKTVWPEVAGEGVSEQAIDALVRRLRDRLAEASDYPFIVTVRGHGFRLNNPAG